MNYSFNKSNSSTSPRYASLKLNFSAHDSIRTEHENYWSQRPRRLRSSSWWKLITAKKKQFTEAKRTVEFRDGTRHFRYSHCVSRMKIVPMSQSWVGKFVVIGYSEFCCFNGENTFAWARQWVLHTRGDHRHRHDRWVQFKILKS